MAVSLSLESGGFTAAVGRASTASKQLKKDIADIQKGGGFDRIIGGMSFVGRGLEENARFSRQLRGNFDALAHSQATLASGSSAAGAGLAKLRAPLTSVANAAIGAGGGIGQFASALTALVAGGGVAALAAAGIFVIVKAYDLLTAKAREARKATDALVESLSKAAQARKDTADPARVVRRTFQGGEGEEGITARMARLNRELAQLESQAAAAGKGGLAFFGHAIERVKQEITATADAAAEAGRQYLETFGTPKPDKLTPQVTGLRDRFGELSESIKATDAEMEAFLAEGKRRAAASEQAVASLRESNVAAVLPKDSSAGFGNVDISGVDLAGITKDLEQGAASQQAASAAADQADQWAEVWTDAIQRTQGSFTEFFANLGRGGSSLVSLFQGVAQSIKQSFAELAGKSIVGGILGSLLGGGIPGAPKLGNLADSLLGAPSFHGGGVVGEMRNVRLVDPAVFIGATRMHPGGRIGLGPSEVPVIAQRGEQILPRGQVAAGTGGGGGQTVQVHQSISFNMQALDGPSVAQMLRAHGGTIAGVVAQAASDSPAFAKHLVNQGLR